jgi:predicted dehydrogenase
MKRRDFLRTTGVSATTLAAGSPFILTNRLWSSGVVRVGVIGTGSRGSGLIRTMERIPTLKVTAGCDILPFRLEEALQHANGATAYQDYRALLDDKEVDAVVVATPLYLHSQMANEALDAGKHVYCEKTMAYNAEQTIGLVNAANQHDSQVFQVGHQYHFSRLYQRVVEIIQGEHIGKVTAFECQWNRNGDWRRPVPEPKYERIINWRMYREYSLGLLAELSSHQIDIVNWVTQAHPLRVIGTGGIDYWQDGRETLDNVHVIFDYPDGIKAKFTCTTANAHDGYQIKVMGDKATIIVKPNEAWIYPEAKGQETGWVDGVSGATKSTLEAYGAIPIKVEHTEPTQQALEDFAENILHQKPPISDVYTGAETSFAVQMALQSILEQRTIDWQDRFTSLN